MKKIIMIIMAMVITPVFAAKMCAVDDSVVVVLDPTIAINDAVTTYDNTLMTWSVAASYGTFSGVSACLSTKPGVQQMKPVALLQYTDSENVSKYVVGGEKLGMFCWCKMTHPTVSQWVYYDSYGSCAGVCANYCAARAKDSAGMRNSLFGTATIDN